MYYSGWPNCKQEIEMLASGRICGFVTTRDYDPARAFYETKLGFQFVSQDPFGLVMKAAENSIRIVKIAGFEPVQRTVLGWDVDDIESVVAWLEQRGVAFEKYPFAQDQTHGIWTAPGGDRVAWFKDPDGNVLSVAQHV
jgi:catechol 2,3-dioxygenase-like lactoylglutathione lyase family enzyme